MTPPNVILVVLDTVRSDRVSGFGYDRETTPNLDRFLSRSTVYRDAVSQAAWSIPSHASLFTGTYPTEHGATSVSPILDYPEFLPATLAAAGYETYAISPNEYVRPGTGFGRGFQEFYTGSRLPRIPSWLASAYAPLVNWGTGTSRIRMPIERRFNDRRVAQPMVSGREHTDAHSTPVARVADVLARASSPYFLFVNVIDAHLPRSPAPEHYQRFVDDDADDVRVVANERAHTFGSGMTDEQLAKMEQLYDADLRTMDDTFGELLDLFSGVGVLEDSLIVVVSDHGEHLGEFGCVGHQNSLFDPVVSVPLAIRYPNGSPNDIDEQVEIRRIYHTILDETGVASFPDRSLNGGPGDQCAYGEFVSPMVDIGGLIETGRARYDRSLMGSVFSFVRDGNSKRLAFGDEEWDFAVPEEPGAAADTQQ